MANHKSAIKVHRQSIKRRDHNRQLRSRMRGALKSVRTAVDTGDTAKAQKAFRLTISLIDNLAGKGVIHANAASRHKSRLTKRLVKALA